MKKHILYIFAFTLTSAIIAFSIIVSTSEPVKQIQAQGVEEPFGGRFTSIEEICCDGTMILEHEAVTSDFPDGTFQTSWSMDAYSELYYFPMPQTCALGHVRSSGSCETLSSECYSSETPDYTITQIGTSMIGCNFVTPSSSSGGSGGI